MSVISSQKLPAHPISLCSEHSVFAHGTNCEASKGQLLHNEQQTCDDIIMQGAVAAGQLVNCGHC
jgi:hypothetical protein